MSRLPYLREGELDQDARALWNTIVETRGQTVVTQEGGLAGPFGPWLHAPDAGRRLAELGAALRFNTSVERRVVGLAVITVGSDPEGAVGGGGPAPPARRHGASPPGVG